MPENTPAFKFFAEGTLALQNRLSPTSHSLCNVQRGRFWQCLFPQFLTQRGVMNIER